MELVTWWQTRLCTADPLFRPALTTAGKCSWGKCRMWDYPRRKLRTWCPCSTCLNHLRTFASHICHSSSLWAQRPHPSLFRGAVAFKRVFENIHAHLVTLIANCLLVLMLVMVFARTLHLNNVMRFGYPNILTTNIWFIWLRWFKDHDGIEILKTSSCFSF